MVGEEKPASLPPPLYPLPRDEEDWSFLSDSAKRDNFWDPIKFTPLNEDRNVFLSLGAEIRETYERFHNTNFGFSPMTRTVIFCSAICFTSTYMRYSDFDSSAKSTAHSKTDEPEVRAL